MATLAIAPEAAIVYIVAVMTAGAGPGKAYLLFRGFFVTGTAIESAVPAVQLEMGALVVIEIPSLPVARVVTLTAVRSQAQLVFVVLLVAGDALALRVFVGLSQMTFLALDFGVFAE